MATITDEEWDRLWQDDPFDTTRLLRVVDTVAWSNSRPSLELRAELLYLHQSAMDVFNYGYRHEVGRLFERAVDYQDRIEARGAQFDQVRAVLSDLLDLYPESLSYDDSVSPAGG
jgi:hypothetical protein